MIKYASGDILCADTEAIVNTVNCVGVMGRGIALQFKKAWPENFKVYARACKNKEVIPGKMFIFETQRLTNPHYIINFPTKRHWRGASRMEDIESGLEALANIVVEKHIQSIAIPPLGSGLGGLNWNDVKSRIEQTFSILPDIHVTVYEPKGAPENDRMVHNRAVPNMTAGRAILIELIQRYLDGLLDPTVSLLEIHKLLYFMQEAGEPLRLKYKKAHYGPYAENLRHVLNAIEGHFVSGYADGGDFPDKPLKLVPGAIDAANSFLDKHSETRERFNRVSKLVSGFESPFGLELLATVHWIKKYENTNTVEDVINTIYGWNKRKQQFTSRQIKISLNALERENWFD